MGQFEPKIRTVAAKILLLTSADAFPCHQSRRLPAQHSFAKEALFPLAENEAGQSDKWRENETARDEK
jgi:hypothetical protein